MITTTSLYWSLPSPSNFRIEFTDAIRDRRAVILNHPHTAELGFGIRSGLRNANFSDNAQTFLTIDDGAHIPSVLAPHFEDRITDAHTLAGLTLAHKHAVILLAHTERAHQACLKFVSQFIQALENSSGNVRLVVSMHDPEWTRSQKAQDLATIVYDGALTAQEMQTYVSFQMLGRKEFGTTQLLHHLVTEFAAYDTVLADELNALSESEIMNLPDSLGMLLAKDEQRWSTDNWINGSRSLTCPEACHPLREWYLAQHAGPQTEFGRVSTDKRYWRACIKAISPWLEERRMQVHDVLCPVLMKLEPSGKFEKKFGNQTDIVEINELEYSDLCFQSKRMKYAGLRLSPRQERAVDLCFKAKAVRHDLAHLRRPKLQELQELVIMMDDFLG